MIQERGGKYSHGVYGTKWVLIKLVNTCFTSEFHLNQINACSIWFSSGGGLRKD